VTAPSWGQVKDLLHQAAALNSEARAKFLDEACASDAALRAELESLLSVGDGMGAEFMESPVAANFGADADAIGAAGLAAGQIFAQRFRLTRELGEGGMGQVWLAQQMAPVVRPVALKLIKAGMYDATVVQRFQAERQSLAIMDHPAIAKVFDAGATPQGQPYFVMEYVPGLPITEYCDQKKLSISERLELFIQVCEGVQHAHQKAIIHRDLKPANILVVEVDGKPVPRIIDFGLAKATTSPMDQPMHTRFGQFIGTPGYMSPERVDPKIQDIDTRTDVYSLGVILYELLTGLQPFEIKKRHRPSLEEWLRQLREEEASRPSSKVSTYRDTLMETAEARGTEPKQLVSSLRGDLDWITLKALERDRERRYGTPTELAAELRRYLNHEPILARPASSAYQIGKFIRRHRVAAVVAAVVTALAIAASGAGLIAVRKQHEAEYQTAQTLQAQSRLLTQAAAQRLKDSDVAGAQGIILQVLTNPALAQARAPAAISVFQEVRAADRQLAVLSGHGDQVHGVAYSRDGTRIVTASRDNTLRIWDARTGVQLAVISGERLRFRSAVYSPDGGHIATTSEDATVRIWDALSGDPVAVFSGRGTLPISATYSPDGTRLVVASLDKTARIWDARTGEELAVLRGHDNVVAYAEYSPDGTRLVTASQDKTARIWDARNGALLAVLSGHGEMLLSASYSPDSTQIVTASADKTARTWNARTGAPLMVLSGHGDHVYDARYSPDGTRIATASDDRTGRIWDARTGALLAVLSGHVGFVRSVEYSPDGSRVVTGSDDGTARVWQARDDTQLAVLKGHEDGVASANYSPDGAHIATTALDKTMRIWDASSGAQLQVLSNSGDYGFGATYSPDGSRIAIGDGKVARIRDARTGASLAVLTGHGGNVQSTAYSPDGTQVATSSLDKTARVWDARTGASLAVLTGHGGRVMYAVFSPDGNHVATASFDKTARIWDARTGAQLAVLSGHAQYVTSIAYSPDGTHLLTASSDKSARIWDARTGALLLMLSGHTGGLESVGYSPDGSRIVTSGGDKTVRIWDAHTGVQLTVLSGHGDSVQSATYSPDGLQIVTASLDKTARIWDARVPASLDAQILWEAAAVTDPLAEVDRADLGMPPDVRVRSWPRNASGCDRAAAAVYDPDRSAPGVLLGNITVDIASSTCSAETSQPSHVARSDYQLGRALLAKKDLNGARQQFQTAAAKGYRAAGVDLADLLAADDAAPSYKKAWQDGVLIAAFRLGHLYEYGMQGRENSASARFRTDSAQAWSWYSQGADAGEPNALARFAEREESTALAATDATTRNTQLLQAFRFYAAAAERAYEENWPDDAWKHWRYRRASLARILAQQGMMQQVADAYAALLDKRSPR
jgi:eukaryotic-like serine/threonine-protein kinase